MFGICGACRTEEFVRIKLDDMQKHGSLYLVKVLLTKTKVNRSFTITGLFARIVEKYVKLRPNRVKSSDRLFVNYQRGKCTVQFIGRNKFSHMPRRIAEYLNLPEPQSYTGGFYKLFVFKLLTPNITDYRSLIPTIVCYRFG